MKSIFNFFLISTLFYHCTDYREISLNIEPKEKSVNYFLIGSNNQPYFFYTTTGNSNSEFPPRFAYKNGYNLQINDSVFPFVLPMKDPFNRNYLSTEYREITFGQNVQILDQDEVIGKCNMPLKLNYKLSKNSIIESRQGAFVAQTFLEYEIINYDKIEYGVSISVNTIAMWKKDVVAISNGAFQGQISDSNYLNTDLCYLPGTVVNTILKPEKLKVMKGKFRIRVPINFPAEIIDKPIIIVYVSNIDENIRNYAENSVKNGYSAQSSYIPFTFLTFNNLKDRYGFVGCYNVGIDTIEIK